MARNISEWLRRLREATAKIAALKILSILAAMALLSACAAISRQTTLTDLKTGQTIHGGFNLVNRTGWVVMADGTKLTGTIFGTTNRSIASGSFVGVSTGGLYSGSSSTTVAATQGQGMALLKSPDGKLLMEISVTSNGTVTSGYGHATTNDGREFAVTW